MKEFATSIISMITTAFVYIIGGIDVALISLLIAIVIDYISGLIKAYVLKELSSKVGFKGILKKFGILLIVALSVIVDKIAGQTGAIRTLVIYYFVANEGLSILENLAQSGLPIPKVIKKALIALKENSEEEKWVNRF